jgi:D-3-phosphoglycerate dehydrogenase / 2-oxoglutarate reductase
MKILVACELPEFAIAELRTLTTDILYQPEIRPDELRDVIPGVGILIVDSRRVSPETIHRGETLQMIVHAGPGPGDISVADASAQGVFVTNCPDQHAVAVAELAFGLMLALDRRVVDNTLALREGRWARGEFKGGRGLAGRTLGLLGYSAASREIATRGRAFGMSLMAWCPALTSEDQGGKSICFCNSPRELARESDIVVVTAAGDGQESRVVADADFLENMKEGASLVHVGSPGAVDETALARVIPVRGLRVALDAFSSEPMADSGRFRSRLFELPGVIGTPHVAALTEQAHNATAAKVVETVRRFLVSGETVHSLNLLEHSPATWQLMLRVRDAVGVMAAILEAIRADGINAEEITSRVFVGARAAWCTIALDERPSTEALEAIRSLHDVLYLEIRAVV